MPELSCVITGANSGIGKAMAIQLAPSGARITMVCRNREKAEQARAEIEAAGRGASPDLVVADLSSMAEVRRAAGEIRSRHGSIDVLINNAGLYLPNRQTTPDGFEYMFAVNHLAAFLLTRLLEEPLLADGGGRVVTTSSGAHLIGHIDFGDLQAQKRFRGLRQYGTTKLANILFTRELAHRWGDRGIVANCFHPGAVATGFAQDELGAFGVLVKLGHPFLRSADRAAETGVYLAADPAGARVNGAYFIGHKPRKPSREGRDDAVARRLWEISEDLCKLS